MRYFAIGAIVLFVTTGCSGDAPPTPTTPSLQPAVMAPTPPMPPAPGSPGDPLAGQYTLNLAAGAGCESLPQIATNRTYAARIEIAEQSSYVVTLSEASFLNGLICTAAPSRLGCHQFLASLDEDAVRFDLINENDDGHGGHITEQVPPGTWVEVIGSAVGRIEHGTITATGSANLWYCSTVSDYPFPCRTFTGCRSDDFRLTFTRR